MFRLDNKVAIVTGAAGGIGAAVARTLARQGALVAAADVRLEELQTLASKSEGRIRAFELDVSRMPDVRAFVDEVRAAYSRIDILVNNAGVCPRVSFADSTEADWERLMTINARSQYFLMQKVCPIMKEHGGGRIINVASSGGRVGSFANASIYSGTKGAIVMFSKSVAREVAADGILVNCVAPGLIDTDLLRPAAARTDALCEQIPLKRLGRPEEVAALIAFLASDQCSYCTGATFDINGGWIML